MKFLKLLLKCLTRDLDYKIVDGHKVHFTGPMSVNRQEATKANWKSIKRICNSFEVKK